MAELTTSFQKIGTGTSKSFNYATGYLELWAKHNGQSIANNYTSVTVELRLVVSGGYIGNYQSTYWSIGGSLSNDGDIGSGSHRSQTLGSATGNIYHNSSGSGSVSFSGGFNPTAWGITLDVSGSATLPSIPRQANITSAPDFTDEGNPTINYSNPAGNSVSSLDACISLTGAIDDVGYRGVSKTGSSYTFYLTESERNVLRSACPNSNSLSVKFFLRTVIGGNTFYSTSTKTMTIVNGNPTFNDFAFADVNPATVTLTGNNQNIIKGYSNVTATVSITNKATANKQATMSKYRFSCGTNTSVDFNYSSSSSVSGTINNVSDGIFNLYAIDSRGNSRAVTKQANSIINYANVSKGNISATRSNGISKTTTLEFNGTWWNDNFRDNSIKSLNVGDVLSKTKLKLNFSNLTYANVYNAGIPGSQMLAKSDNGYQIELTINSDPRLGDSASVDLIYIESNTRHYIDTLWLVYSDETVETNLTEYDLSTGFGTPSFDRQADFGTLIQVDNTNLIYPMVKYENAVCNTLSANYKYKKTNSSNWVDGATTLTLAKSNNDYSFNGLIAGDDGNNGFDINYSYDIQVIVEDELSNAIFTTQLASGIPHIAYAKDGVGIMGKYDANAGGPFQIQGKCIDFIVESGTSGIWKYRKWNSGLAECWGTHTQGLTTSRTWGPLYRGEAFDLAYPFTFAEVPQEIYGFSSNVSAIALTYSQNNTTRTTTYNAVYYQNTTIEIHLNLYVRGRWK